MREDPLSDASEDDADTGTGHGKKKCLFQKEVENQCG